MASKKVSPKGVGSGIKMIQMYINRAGKKLDSHQKKELETAKHILQDKKAKHDQTSEKKPGKRHSKKKRGRTKSKQR